MDNRGRRISLVLTKRRRPPQLAPLRYGLTPVPLGVRQRGRIEVFTYSAETDRSRTSFGSRSPPFPEQGARLGQVHYPEQPPRSWDALQRVTAAILEADAGSHHQITQRA